MPIMHVSREDLELYLLARLPEHQLSVVESHLTNCSSCMSRLSEVAGLAFRILRLSSRLGDYGGTEKRREHRIPADDPGQMQVFSPFSLEKIRVQITDISRNGLKVRMPRFVQRASIVQVHVKEAIILGEVRYCIEAGAEFDAGIQIQDVVARLRT
jgi:hypothetical protein